MTIMSNQKITQIFPQKKRRIAHEKKTTADLRQQQVAGPSRDQKEEDLQVLRQFDMNWQYGPCTNITRLERWNRAEKLDLDPPINVKRLIESHLNDKNYTENVWVDYKL